MENKLTFAIENYNYDIYFFSEIGKGKIENQDVFKIDFLNNRIAITLCDGLGSSKFSRLGAQEACNICNELMLNSEFDDILENIQKKWLSKFDGDTRLYDTTIKYLSIDNLSIKCGGIGDGWLLLRNQNEIISKTSNHEYLNKTNSITSPLLPSVYWNENYNNEKDFFALMATDGFSEDINKDNLNKFIKEIIDDINNDEKFFINDIKQLLKEWPVITNTDDKTVIIVIKKENKHE